MRTPEEVQRLWMEYKRNGDSVIREKLIIQ